MPFFTLKKNRRNVAIAEAIKSAYDDVKVSVQKDRIYISFKYDVTFSVLDLNTYAIATDEHWRSFMKEIKRTLTGAKIREFNKLIIGISPLRTRRLYIRLTPSEKNLMRKAAEISGTTVTDFARTAILNAAGETLNEETARRMERRAEEKTREEERKTRTYVS